MQKIKISIAAMALLFTIGITYAGDKLTQTNAPLEDCRAKSTDPFGVPTAQYDPEICNGEDILCCYELNSPNEILRPQQ